LRELGVEDAAGAVGADERKILRHHGDAAGANGGSVAAEPRARIGVGVDRDERLPGRCAIFAALNARAKAAVARGFAGSELRAPHVERDTAATATRRAEPRVLERLTRRAVDEVATHRLGQLGGVRPGDGDHGADGRRGATAATRGNPSAVGRVITRRRIDFAMTTARRVTGFGCFEVVGVASAAAINERLANARRRVEREALDAAVTVAGLRRK